MRDPLLTDVLYALDQFVAERQADSSFKAMTPPPPWLARYLTSEASGPVTLAQAFPFLDHFLTDAEEFWREGTRPLLGSGPFVVSAPEGELLLRATALNVGVHCVLVLSRLEGDADPRPVLQHAREQALVQERMSKELAGLADPARELTRLARALLDTNLTNEQRALAEGLSIAAARIHSAAAVKR
jgi:hypothetical protein